MCQAKRDGGRRCPIHRHDSIAVMNIATSNTELNKVQIEHTFRELNREGRGSDAPTQEQWDAFKAKIRETGNESALRNLDKADQHSELPDGKTFYSMTKLVERASKRNENLKNLIERTAQEKGYSLDEVKAKFSEVYDASKREYGEGRPDGYSQAAYTWARNNSLPYDTQSVVAIKALRGLPARSEGVSRVNRIKTGHRIISEVGYNIEGGRLEVKMALTGRVLSYQNVPVSTYESLISNGRPAEYMVSNYVNRIASRAEYRYEDAAASETDKEAVRCANCGQFASPVDHACPDSTEIEVLPPVTSSKSPVEESGENQEGAKVYDPANPTPMWEGDHPEYRKIVDYTPEEIADRAGFTIDQVKNAEDIAFTYTAVLPEQRRNLEPGSELGRLASLEGSRLIQSELYEMLDGHEALQYGIATRYYTDSYEDGVRQRGRETKIFDVRKIVNYGALTAPGRTFNTRWMGDGKISIPVVNEEFKRYPMADAGEFTAQTYSEEYERIQADGAPVLPLRATYTNNIRFDSATRIKHPIKISTISEIRRAMRNNDRFYMPVEVARPHGKSMVDDQNHIVNYHDMNVSGLIEYKKDENGKWNAVYNRRSLKCYCADYRRNYNCHHIDAVLRKGNNLLYQSGALNNAGGTERVNLNQIDNGQYLNTTLARRDDLEVTAPNDEKGQELHYKFTELVNRQAGSRQNGWYDRNDMYYYYEHINDVNSYADYVANNEAISTPCMIREFKTIHNPRDVVHALRRGGVVEVPVEASIGPDYWVGNRKVEGTVSMRYDADEKVQITGNTLKCDCLDYQQKYDCMHVRATLANSVHIPFIGSRDYQPEGDTHNRQRRNQVMSSENFNQYMSMHNISLRNSDATEEELFQLYQEEQAAQAARQARWEEEDRERRARHMERQREFYARVAVDNRQSVESFKEANPEYAKSLIEYRENLMSKWDSPESSYVSDKEKLDNAIKAALGRKKKGEDVVPFRAEGGVLDGSSAGPAGRKFGVELEFTIKSSHNRATSLSAIAKELHEAGLTSTDRQVSYHSAAANGYAKWSFEKDCTVHGELVSPILDDSPESWRQLKVATEIIQKHGGTATARAGSHVHVSTGSYEASTAKAAELLRVVKENEDLMYRMASSPARGKHRGTRWCQPNMKDDGGDIDLDSKMHKDQIGSHGHGAALNISPIGNDLKKSNAEFRVWDGTLDPGVIQAQVMMSVAMVDKAEYNVLQKGSSPARPGDNDKRFGFHKGKGVAHTETHNEGGIAEYLDTFFRKDEDKNQIASLFAVTKWQGN